MKPRKSGERVRHIDRPDLGDGHVTHLYDDGHCDVEFPDSTFSWVELSAFQSIEAETALQELDRLLYNGEMDQADGFYKTKCAEYLNLEDFEQRKATAQAAYEQRVARDQAALHDEVAKLLDRFEFEAADDLYASRCRPWWPLEEYKALRAHAACAFEQRTGFYPVFTDSWVKARNF